MNQLNKTQIRQSKIKQSKTKQSQLNQYQFHHLAWHDADREIMALREKVFIVEQRFNSETLFDHQDADCFHILVRDQNQKAVACGRLNQNGRIGRIAVAIEHRGQGIGTHLLNQLISIGERNKLDSLTLNTEMQLSRFYDQRQFQVDGPVYMKSGVPFQRMRMNLVP
jgi:predicted GNAT family N-acyltransferase